MSAYDAIAYLNEHLSDDMVVNVQGNIKYSFYKGNVNMHRIQFTILSTETPRSAPGTELENVQVNKGKFCCANESVSEARSNATGLKDTGTNS